MLAPEPEPIAQSTAPCGDAAANNRADSCPSQPWLSLTPSRLFTSNWRLALNGSSQTATFGRRKASTEHWLRAPAFALKLPLAERTKEKEARPAGAAGAQVGLAYTQSACCAT